MSDIKERLRDICGDTDDLAIYHACDKAISHIAQLEAMVAANREIIDGLLAHCPDGECYKCGEIICPHNEPLHFHHDGCPACESLASTQEAG